VAESEANDGVQERDRIVARAGVVGAGTLFSRVLGYVRDACIAALFSKDQTDAFSVALTIPNTLRQLLAEGAVSSAVVPVLAARLDRDGEAGARLFFARARGLSLVVLAAVAVAGVCAAEPLTALFASGYRARPGQFERTVALTRVMFPYIFFMGTAAMGMAALNAKKRFAVAAFAPALFNVALIAAALVLRHPLEARGVDGSMALGIGVLAGGVWQVVAQWPALRAIGYASMPRFDWRDPHVREMARRIGPMTLGFGIYYVNLTLSRRFLSELGSGAQSYFFWASRVCDLPQGVFVMALSTAALPSLATFAAANKYGELATTWARGMRLSMFVALPCSAALAALSLPLVSLLFERGQFGLGEARETARALAWQGAAVFTVAAVRQMVAAFYALGDTRTPVMVSAINLGVFVALASVLRGPLGHVGISIAVAGASAAQMVLLAVGLRRRLGTLRGREIALSLARMSVAAAVAGAMGWASASLMSAWCASVGVLRRTVPGVVGSSLFLIVYSAIVWGLDAPEVHEVWGPIQKRLRRVRAPKA